MTIHLVILRSASWLVPGERRVEWLAEWSAELWHVRQRGGWRAARFCLGSFRDARWLRRNSPPDAGPWLRLESPAQCLGTLGAAAGVCLLLALGFGPPKTPLVPVGPPLLAMLYLAAMSMPVVLATTSLRLGEYPAHRSGRRWAFFAAKIALVMPIVFFGALALWPILRMLLIYVMLPGYVIAFRWALADQRRRCPECLRLVSHPAPIGEPSHVLLEWYGTEFACAKGHGLLHVPEIPTVSFRTQTWMRLDRSWRALFS
jgi:hypothetical protein